MANPAAVGASPNTQRRAYQETIVYLSRRLDLLLALPLEELERTALGHRVRAIGRSRYPRHRTLGGVRGV